MSARGWLRRRLAAYAYPEIARLDQVLADRTVGRDKAVAEVARLTDQLVDQLASTRGVMDAWRTRALNAERDRDAWRLQARSVPLTVVDEDAERAVRHAEAEQTGGR